MRGEIPVGIVESATPSLLKSLGKGLEWHTSIMGSDGITYMDNYPLKTTAQGTRPSLVSVQGDQFRATRVKWVLGGESVSCACYED